MMRCGWSAPIYQEFVGWTTDVYRIQRLSKNYPLWTWFTSEFFENLKSVRSPYFQFILHWSFVEEIVNCRVSAPFERRGVKLHEQFGVVKKNVEIFQMHCTETQLIFVTVSLQINDIQ